MIFRWALFQYSIVLWIPNLLIFLKTVTHFVIYSIFFFTFEISFYGINLLYSTSLLPKWSISPKPFPANSICLPLKMPPITSMFPYPIVPSLFAVVWIVCYLTTQLHLITPSFWKYPSLTFLFTIIFWFFTRFICHFSFSFVSSFFFT